MPLLALILDTHVEIKGIQIHLTFELKDYMIQELKTYLSSSQFFSFNLTAFSRQNFSDLCTGLHSSLPDLSSELYSSKELQHKRPECNIGYASMESELRAKACLLKVGAQFVIAHLTCLKTALCRALELLPASEIGTAGKKKKKGKEKGICERKLSSHVPLHPSQAGFLKRGEKKSHTQLCFLGILQLFCMDSTFNFPSQGSLSLPFIQQNF